MRTIPLAEAESKYGVIKKDGDETYMSLCNSPKVFNWDWKMMSRADSDSTGDNFLRALDNMLSFYGAEVVLADFQGDACFWWIEKKI